MKARLSFVRQVYEAICDNDFEKFKLFVKRDNVNQILVDGKSILHIAVAECRLSFVEYCLFNGANTELFNNAIRWTPLHQASFYGSAIMVRMLLDFGADMEKMSRYGTSPLELAVETDKFDVVKLLIDRGAKVETIPWVPQYARDLVSSRDTKRLANIVVIGCHKYKLQPLTRGQDVNVLRLIGKHIWSQRLIL